MASAPPDVPIATIPRQRPNTESSVFTALIQKTIRPERRWTAL
jgi:hypothetical protein